ncbi:MAG: hypothetical protein AB7W16_11845 [Candidatus Obscuribacterales bacterium]
MTNRIAGKLSLLPVLIITCMSLGACSEKTPEPEAPSQSSITLSNTPGESGPVTTPRESPEPEPSPAPRSAPSFERGTYLQKHKPSQAQRGPSSQAVAQYGRQRLDNAAVIKNYAPVSIIPIGLDAYCKTAWADGLLHVRVAIMGPPANMQLFLRQFSVFKLGFRDQGANLIQDAVVPATEFKLAPPSVNHGSPTFEFEGQMEIPLEKYEQFYDWTLNWE